MRFKKILSSRSRDTQEKRCKSKFRIKAALVVCWVTIVMQMSCIVFLAFLLVERIYCLEIGNILERGSGVVGSRSEEVGSMLMRDDVMK